MTVVSPSLIRTSVVAFFLLIEGVVDPGATSPWESFFTSTFIETRPSGVMCGVTFRLRVASINCTFVPEADTVEYGICVPCSMTASLLSVVTIFGEEMIFPFPDASSGGERKVEAKVVLQDPERDPAARPQADRRREVHGIVRNGGRGGEGIGGRRTDRRPGMDAPVGSFAPVTPYLSFPPVPP